MNKMHLNILGFKNFPKDQLEKILDELKKIEPGYLSVMHEPIRDLQQKIRMELGKRERRGWVWVQFESYWSGYSSSQRKLVGRHYRKMSKVDAFKIGNYFSYQFTDNTTNDWSIKVVDIRGKDEGGYSGQIDQFLKEKGIK